VAVKSAWAVLAVLAAALALISLDNTIVNVALPTLQEELRASTAQLQWVVDAYSVLFAGTLLLAGSLGDRFGRRRMLIVGLSIFILASLSAVFAQDANALTLSRALMGIGGAFIMPSTLSILVQVFTDRTERARAIGIWAAVAGVGVALGPIIGGFLLEHFSWHSIFWVNPPVAAAVLVATLLLVPESRDPAKPKLDPLGAALSSLGVVALVVTVIELPDSGLSALTVGAAAVAVVSLTAFVWWEKRAARPILPMELFSSRLFSTSIITVGLVYFALMGAMFFLPQFLQLVQGMSPLESGIAILPGAGGLLVASLFSPGIAERIGTRKTVVLGLSLVTVAMASFALLRTDTSYLFIGIVLGTIGLGLGLTLPQATNGVLAAVPAERAGMGSAVNDAVGELGGSFGVAILGATLSFAYRQNIEEAITTAGAAAQQLPASALDAARESLAAASIQAGQLPDGVGDVFRQVAGQAFVSGMSLALLVGAGITGLGLLIAWRRFPVRVDRVEE
jgi:MFS transporter, DHA2 family, multidrug resistance protein